ncbi:MAG: tail fiber domain-containing protein [Bacteroidota bacterium]
MKVTLLFFFSIAFYNLSAQNFGINTLTPARAKLEVIGVAGTGNTSGIFGVGYPGISIQQNWPTIGFNQYRDENNPFSQGRYMANGFAAIQFMEPVTGIMGIDMFASGTAGSFTPAGRRAMTFTPAGNVGIRTGIANASLAVARGEGVDGSVAFQGEVYTSYFNKGAGEDTYIRSGRKGTKVFISNQSGGDVIIGHGATRLFINRPISTNSSTVELEKNSNDLFFPHISLVDSYGKFWNQQFMGQTFRGSDNAVGFNLGFYYQDLIQNKGYFNWITGGYIYNSDRRLKKDIAPLEPVLNRLRKLQVDSYEMKDGNPGHRRSIGFIAQEVKQLFPDAVKVITHQNGKGPVINDLHTMNYSYFGVIAIKALKEQWQQLKELEQEQANLLGEIEDLQQEANRLSGR